MSFGWVSENPQSSYYEPSILYSAQEWCSALACLKRSSNSTNPAPQSWHNTGACKTAVCGGGGSSDSSSHATRAKYGTAGDETALADMYGCFARMRSRRSVTAIRLGGLRSSWLRNIAMTKSPTFKTSWGLTSPKFNIFSIFHFFFVA